MEGEEGLLVFRTTNLALKIERLLGENGVPVTVIPTPIEISAECGIALLLEGAGVDEATRLLESSSETGFRMICPFVKGKRH